MGRFDLAIWIGAVGGVGGGAGFVGDGVALIAGCTGSSVWVACFAEGVYLEAGSVGVRVVSAIAL